MIEPPDDLKRITGIGLATESRLKAAGITTFVKLSRLTPVSIARIVPGRPAARIARENWIGQARQLASSRSPVYRRRKGRIKQGHQHYATFTVELLLNADNSVKGTRVTHVQSEVKKSWGGWKKARLVDFLIQQGRLNLRLSEREPGYNPSRKRVSAYRPKAGLQTIPPPEPILPMSEFVSTVISISSSEIVPPVEPATTHECSSESETHTLSLPTASLQSFDPDPDAHSMFRIGELDTFALGSNVSGSIVLGGQRFSMRFMMNLAELRRSFDAPLSYVVTIWAKKLGERSRAEVVGKGEDTLVMLEDEMHCTVEAVIASVGTYRLWVETTITQLGAGSLPPSSLLSASISKLLQVC